MTDFPGFPENPDNREVVPVRSIRFERWPNSTVKNPNPVAEPVPMQFEAVPDLNGKVGVVGRASIRGALYAIGMTKHDLTALVEVCERLEDKRRGEYSRG